LNVCFNFFIHFFRSRKLIPIPYESHYLCIYQTLAKKGWKAYWYQKCRCAKGEKKKTEESTSKDESLQDETIFEEEQERSLLKEEDVQNEKNPVTVDTVNYNNNSSKVAQDACDSNDVTVPTKKPYFSKATQTVYFTKGTQTDESHENKQSKSLSSNKRKEITKVFAKTSIRKVLKCNDKKSNTSQEIAETELLNEKKFEKQRSFNHCAAPCTSFKLRTLTRNDIENALLQLDEGFLSKLNLDARRNDNGNDNLFTIPNLETVNSVLKTKPTDGRFFNLSLQTRRKEVAKKVLSKTERQEKVDATVRLLMESSSSGSELVDRLASSRVFAQCFEEIDKQPGCLDLISVNPFVVNESPKLSAKVSELCDKRKSRKSFLLNSSKTSPYPASKHDINDLECIWAFGKSSTYFTENPVAKSYAKTRKTKVSRLPAAKKTARPAKPYLAFKRTIKKFNKPKRNTYKHHARRPKADIPFQPVVEAIVHQPKQEHYVGIEPYIARWKIPEISHSEVVGKLENIWGEVTGFAGIFLERLPTSNGNLLTPVRVAHALTAMKDNGDIFTFSSKPKDGQNTVLLIRRKVRKDSDESERSDCGITGSILPSTPPCTDDLSDVSSNSGQSKLLLKLKKTGEVSGSVIYSVSDSDECHDDASSSGQECSSKQLAEEKDDTNSINTCTNDVCTAYSAPNDTLVELTQKEKHSTETHLQPLNLEDSDDLSENEASKMTINYSEEIQGPCASPNGSSCSSSVGFSRSALESEFDRSCSELDFDNINDVMHSTMLSESDQKSDFMPFKSLRFSDFAGSDAFMDEKQLRILDWDGTMEGQDDLEELLMSINQESIDALEQTFVFEGDLSIPPSRLQHALKLKSENSLQNRGGFYNRQHSYTPICLNPEKSTCYARSSPGYQFKENFAFDSPEMIRGSSHSKSSSESNPAPLFSNSMNEEVNATPSESICLPNGESIQERTQESSPTNSVIKTCNVLLEPLEEMLEDFQKNGTQSDCGETSNPSSQFRFTESSVRELNRLLKNRALNGAYWKSMEFDSNSSTSSSSSSRWCFRDRSKKKEDPLSTEIDLEVNVESEREEVDTEDEKEPGNIPFICSKIMTPFPRK